MNLFFNQKLRLFGIRGATGCENTKESIAKNVVEMCSKLFSENKVLPENIVSIQFTSTNDLTAMNPAAALRRGGDCGIDVSSVPLFCSQEPEIEGSPEKMIRILVTAYLASNSKVKPVYINGGEKLRPDFAKKIKKSLKTFKKNIKRLLTVFFQFANI